MFKKVVILYENSNRIDSFSTSLEDRAMSVGYRLEVRAGTIEQAGEFNNVDLVLLEPKIRFELNKAKDLFPNVKVDLIDMRTFATKNEDDLLNAIKKYFGK